jgi:hypothetical protein
MTSPRPLRLCGESSLLSASGDHRKLLLDEAAEEGNFVVVVLEKFGILHGDFRRPCNRAGIQPLVEYEFFRFLAPPWNGGSTTQDNLCPLHHTVLELERKSHARKGKIPRLSGANLPVRAAKPLRRRRQNNLCDDFTGLQDRLLIPPGPAIRTEAS